MDDDDPFNSRLKEATDRNAQRIAFVDGIGRLTFAEMETRVAAAARWLRDRGCTRGQGVAALTWSSTLAVALEWATYRIGGIWLGVPAREKRPEVTRDILSASKPVVFFLEHGVLDATDWNTLLSSAILQSAEREEYKGLDAFVFDRNDGPAPDCFSVDGKPAVRIRFSSGTTGEPKGIIYTSETREAIFQIITSNVLGEIDGGSSNEAHVMIHGAPTAWASGSLIAPVYVRGGRNVILTRWDTAEFAKTVDVEECTLTFLAPTMLRRLVKYSEAKGTKWSRSLKHVLIAGGPMPVTTMRRAKKLFSFAKFYTTLGMTEASFPITWREVRDADVDPKSNPRPFVPLGHLTGPYEKSDLDGRERGELMVSKGAVAAGRWAWTGGVTVTALSQPYVSGDILERDEQAVYHYVCRRDRSCEGKDIWISPEAIEAVLQECEYVEYVRVDNMKKAGATYRVCLTVQTPGVPLDDSVTEAIRKQFEDKKNEANLREVEIDRITDGHIEMTPTGKPVRKKDRLCE